MRAILLSSCLLLAAAFAPAQAQQAALAGLTEGVDYQPIEGGKPYRAVPGTIEVVEVFAYWCPHCAHFDPMVERWKRTLPKNVRLTYVPLVSGPDDVLARTFFAAQASKSLTVLHPRLFQAIHETGQLPRQPEATQVGTFVAGISGVNATAFKAAMADDAALRSKLAYAREFALRSDVPGTPAMVVDGRYLVLGNSYQGLLDNADRIIKALTPASKPVAKPTPRKRST